MSKAREIGSKVAGGAEQAAAIFTGEIGILNTLKKEHTEVSMLMTKVSKSGDNETGARVRRDLFPKIRAELLSHARAEERTLYTELQRHNLSRDLALNNLAGHKGIEEILTRLSHLDVLDPRWITSFQNLENLVQQHIKDEEEDLFERSKQVLHEDQLRDLDSSFKKEKHDELDHLLPRSAAE